MNVRRSRGHQNTVPDQDEDRLRDLRVTERSLKQGMAQILGTPCDILWTALYVRAARRLDETKLTFDDIFKLVDPFRVSSLHSITLCLE